MSVAHISFEKHSVNVSGEITINTINKHFDKYAKKIIRNKIKEIDLSEVKKVDTAGIAWLLYLVEQAKMASFQVEFIGLPKDLLQLAKLYAVDTFLSIH